MNELLIEDTFCFFPPDPIPVTRGYKDYFKNYESKSLENHY